MASKLTFKYKLATGAAKPLKATPGAAGWDLTALERQFVRPEGGDFAQIDPKEAKMFDIAKYRTGVFIEIPEDYALLTFPRSSIAKMPLLMANSVGVFDSDYRGEIIFAFRILDPKDIAATAYQVGDRIGQLLLVKLADLNVAQVDKLSDSERGHGAYGSTGR